MAAKDVSGDVPLLLAELLSVFLNTVIKKALQ